MKRFTKFGVIGASVVLATSLAHAANTDLVLGITGNGASSDAVVDLGSAAQVGVGGASVVDLIDSRGASFSATGLSGTSFQSLLSSVFSGGVNGANMTLAGGQGGSSTFFYLSANRGSAGSDPTAPLSTTPTTWSKNQQGTVGGYPAGVLNGASISFQGGNAAISDGTASAPNTSSFSYLILGVNNLSTSVNSYQLTLPNTTVSGGKAYEDVWFNKASGSSLLGWQYQGYLTLDLTGDTTQLLTFTPAAVAVPEPGTYGLMAGLGLLVVAVRRQFSGKVA